MDDPRLESARRRLMAEIDEDVRQTAVRTGRPALSARVMAAMERVRREAFVLPDDADLAFANRPLPIGHGQTISQPFIVALMTDLLDLAPGDRVLEVGTGSGYQAAVLAELVARVFSVETVADLAAAARRRLKDLGYANVDVRHGDGYAGWPERSPFDAVIVTAAAPSIPEALVDQLKPGGRLVIPVGQPGGRQMLVQGLKKADGTLERRDVIAVAFVPMVKGI